MTTALRYASLLLLSPLALPVGVGFTQQTPPPATASATSTPSTATQDLPDSPGSQVSVSPQPSGPTAVFDSTMGRMTCRLFDKQAPLAVANFIGLAEGTKDWTDPATHAKVHGRPLYNGTVFHRVIPDFMIQGGDPVGTGMGDPGYFFNDEIDPALNFDVAGRLAMANSGPNTNGSQFFITTAPATHLNGRHTIFGQCDEPSITVAKAITGVSRDADDKPNEPVVLNKVTIVREGQPMPAVPAPRPSAPATAPGSTHP